MAGPLDGLRAIDASTLFAGPMVATLLADLGADVIKVEQPSGDGQRRMAWQVGGTSLLWSVTNRNKRGVTLDLHMPSGQELFRRLVVGADILVENFRPGRLERWGCGYEQLAACNPGLVMVRVTAFGQTGPWKDRPGFGTVAEAMSGFAHINGTPEGPPTLPPFALGDNIAGVFGAFAAVSAIVQRDRSPEGRGQYIDLSIYEPIFSLLGPQISVYDRLGLVQERTGNRVPFTSPRGTYRSCDGKWIAISASAQSIAERLMQMVGAPEYVERDWFASHVGRLEHQDELDAVIAGWVAARSAAEVMEAVDRWEVAACPVYSIADIALDEQFLARESFVSVPDGDGGHTAIQNVVPRFSGTPAGHRCLGPALGAHNREVYGDELGYGEEALRELEADGVI